MLIRKSLWVGSPLLAASQDLLCALLPTDGLQIQHGRQSPKVRTGASFFFCRNFEKGGEIDVRLRFDGDQVASAWECGVDDVFLRIWQNLVVGAMLALG